MDGVTVPAPRVLVVGEALVDVVPDATGQPRDLPGGSPANVAITLGRLERDVRLVTLLGDDQRGDAGPCHAAPLGRCRLVTVDGGVPQADPRDVEHRVRGSGGQGADDHPQVARTWHARILPEPTARRVGCCLP